MALPAAAAVLVLAVASGPAAGHQKATPASSTGSVLAGIHKIRHIVIIMQENRSYDSYFGTYRHADGIPGLAGHHDRVPCLPNYPKRRPCVRPFHDRHDNNYGGPHVSLNFKNDVNGGKMNGFVIQQKKACKCNPPQTVMGYHTGNDIPNYWMYARDFVLEDHMFASTVSWSLPAHLYMVSEWSAHCKTKKPSSCKSQVDPPIKNPTNPDQYAWTDLTYLLYQHHVSWRYYIFKGIEPDCDSNITQTCVPVTQGPKTPSTWNPLLYFETVHKDHQTGNIQSLNDFFTAAKAGKLPAVSWIVPNESVSEHPQVALVSKGQTYVTGLIDTIMQSPDWNSTAIFLAWDDWGGMYDHLKPPRVDLEGYGLRVPALMISPYARKGYVDHQTLSFDAYAKFIEDDFLGGQRLNPKTDGRPDPRPDVRENARQLGNLINEFNFSQTPRKPVMLPVCPKTGLKPTPRC